MKNSLRSVLSLSALVLALSASGTNAQSKDLVLKDLPSPHISNCEADAAIPMSNITVQKCSADTAVSDAYGNRTYEFFKGPMGLYRVIERFPQKDCQAGTYCEFLSAIEYSIDGDRKVTGIERIHFPKAFLADPIYMSDCYWKVLEGGIEKETLQNIYGRKDGSSKAVMLAGGCRYVETGISCEVKTTAFGDVNNEAEYVFSLGQKYLGLDGPTLLTVDKYTSLESSYAQKRVDQLIESRKLALQR